MKTDIRLWRFSVGFFVAVFIYGAWFVYKKTVAHMIVLVILTAVSCALYVYARKRITLPEGYTVLQAKRFYRDCTAEGLTSRRRMAENPAVLKRIVKRHEYAVGFDEDAIWKLYCCGRAEEDAVKK